MPIDEMFQDGTDKVLDDRVARPLAEPTIQPSFGANLFGLKGVPAGVAESGGFLSDILSAYGKVNAQQLAQSDPSNLFDPVAAEKARTDSAPLRKQLDTGEAFSTEGGDILRSVSRDMAPDPNTAHAAEQVVFGLTRFVTKAVGYSMAGGPVPGAIMVGADEGMTEADRLKVQGVDIQTRMKVGTVAGVTAGTAVALPIAGAGWKTTAGLVAVGGPGGFVFQQAASKAILENAGYDRLANQHDPFDPVGLAVSSLIPLPFAAYGMRGAKIRAAEVEAGPVPRQLDQMGGSERQAMKYDDARLDAYTVAAAQREDIPPEMLLAIKNAGERSGSTAVSPKGARGVMQFMPETWNTYGKGDPRDPVASIDAGAKYMKDLLKQYDGNVQAALAHYNGGNKAGRAIMEGRLAPALETRKYLARTEKFIAEHAGTQAGRAAAGDPEIVSAVRVDLARYTAEAANLRGQADQVAAQQHLDAVNRAADQIAAGERVEVAEILPLDTAAQVKMMDEIAARVEASREDGPAGAVFDPDIVAGMRAEGEALGQIRQAMDDVGAREAPAVPDPHQGASFGTRAEVQTYMRENKISSTHRVKNTGRDKYGVEPKTASKSDWRAKVAAREAKLADQLLVAEQNAAARRPAAPAPKAAPPSAAPKAAPDAPAAPPGAPKAAGEANPMADFIATQADELTRLSPDMMVQLEGMTAPARLADAMEAVRAEAAADAADAPLLQVAANCLLGLG